MPLATSTAVQYPRPFIRFAGLKEFLGNGVTRTTRRSEVGHDSAFPLSQLHRRSPGALLGDLRSRSEGHDPRDAPVVRHIGESRVPALEMALQAGPPEPPRSRPTAISAASGFDHPATYQLSAFLSGIAGHARPRSGAIRRPSSSRRPVPGCPRRTTLRPAVSISCQDRKAGSTSQPKTM